MYVKGVEQRIKWLLKGFLLAMKCKKQMKNQIKRLKKKIFKLEKRILDLDCITFWWFVLLLSIDHIIIVFVYSVWIYEISIVIVFAVKLLQISCKFHLCISEYFSEMHFMSRGCYFIPRGRGNTGIFTGLFTWSLSRI